MSSSNSAGSGWWEVVVEVCRAENLMAKDGQGSASAYVEVEVDGERKKTGVRPRDLNPVWNQKLLFHVERFSSSSSSSSSSVDDVAQLYHPTHFHDFRLHINVYSAHHSVGLSETAHHDLHITARRRSHSVSFLGRVRIPGSAALVPESKASVVAYPLHKRSFFSHVRGQLYLRIFSRPPPTLPRDNSIVAAHAPPSSTAVASRGTPSAKDTVSMRTTSSSDDGDSDSCTTCSSSTSSLSPLAMKKQQDTEELVPQCIRTDYHHHTQLQPLRTPPLMSSTSTKEQLNQTHPLLTAGTQSASSKSSVYTPPAATSQNGRFYVSSHVATPGNDDFQLKETRPKLAAIAKKRQVALTRGGSGEGDAAKVEAEVDARLGLAAGSSYDLVERMEYLYVKVVRAKRLRPKDMAMATASSGVMDAYVLLKVGSTAATTRVVERSLNPEWNEVFAFGKNKFQAPLLELMVKDRHPDHTQLGATSVVVGYLAFDLSELPVRVPPDSALAPQWYKLEKRKPGKRGNLNNNNNGEAGFQSDVGEIMLSVWKGTQADEALGEATWHSDAGGGVANQALARSKVYMSPRLWYLRVHVIEAQDLLLTAQPPPNNANQVTSSSRVWEVRARVQLGFQVAITKPCCIVHGSSNPSWNEDLLFVAAEPFEDPLILTVEERVASSKDQVVGGTLIAIASVERRTDRRHVTSRWYNLHAREQQGGGPRPANASAKPQDYAGAFSKHNNYGKALVTSRVHVRVCLEGGYHVMDESTQLSSDMRPSSRSLWPAPVGVLELGILRATGLMPTKSSSDRSRGTTDAYVVAKYGPKWVRSRTVVDCFSPTWNEQYTWEVYDPCTVLTVAIFDNSSINLAHTKQQQQQHMTLPDKLADSRLGKVRIRLSTLDSGRVYSHSYPLLLLHPSGVKKMGELELAVRFSALSSLNLLGCYARPMLPKMHYILPLNVAQVDTLRKHAVRIIAARLVRAEPPVKPEVVQYMLEAGEGSSGGGGTWSMRKSKANWVRIAGLMSGAVEVARWMSEVRDWRNPAATILVHVLVVMLVCYPDLILPTLFLYMFLVGAWQYRWRPRQPPHMDMALSQLQPAGLGGATNGTMDELEEEMDGVPSECKAQDVLRSRYDRLRALAGRVQGVAGDLATQGERICSLLSWRDPRATALFLLVCLLSSFVFYLVPLRALALCLAFFYLRHPRFRRSYVVPSLAINFFRRLPACSDLML